jgi:hypothetical protein
MPYLFWAEKAQIERDTNPGIPGSQSSKSSSGDHEPQGSSENQTATSENQLQEKSNPEAKSFIHKSLTLDQFYYASIPDTSNRDEDQVVGRYLQQKIEDLLKEGSKPGQDKKMTDSQVISKQETSKATWSAQILVVNQLWLWILYDGMSLLHSTVSTIWFV